MNFRRPTVLTAMGVVATLVLALVVVVTLLLTGGSKALSDNAVLIGALVALGGVFTAQMVSITLDDRRSQEARDIEAQRAHETALQKYFEDVGKLLIEQPLRRASLGDNLSTVVRAQTLAVLEGLDPRRKRILIQFLNESMLIHKSKPVVSLVAANLHEVYLIKADLSETDLHEVDLSGAFLSEADLREADLSGAKLRDAKLLRKADLSEATLRWADLRKADLRDANLRDAALFMADLRDADLCKADLRDANLRDANRSKSFLTDADLSGAYDFTNLSVVLQAKYLGGATLPDGQNYEDWLKNDLVGQTYKKRMENEESPDPEGLP